ncbi:DUF177 domain-containing protein [Riemerella anatipestifer]|nr:DUF177 domain-containing protein [Riemerella anatipestifer]
MDKFRKYDIVFSGLKNGKHQFEFEIDKEFFNLFNADIDFSEPKVLSSVLLEKHTTFLEFCVKVSGEVCLICDVSGDDFPYEIEHELNVLVKFGESYDDSNEEVITIPSNDYHFNVAQLIYEAVILSVPMKKISPKVEGNEEYEALLEKYSPKVLGELEEDKSKEDIDPRWQALSKLKNK